MLLNPNCSEAVCRVLLDNLSEEEINKLISLIKFMEMTAEGETVYFVVDIDERKPINECEFSDPKFEKEIKECWYDVSWHVEDVFGMQVIVIKGDTPYNYGEWLENTLREKLPFGKKLKIQFSDV